MVEIANPYQDVGSRWLKGEIHAHVCWSRSGQRYDDGVHPDKIYEHAHRAGLDFVCMSVDVTAAKGGIGHFGDVGSGRQHAVTGIPAREIQNNNYTDYFTEAGARYLHVLTIGEAGGLSLCCHPLYYEVGNKKDGGEWSTIREALLAPTPGGHLDSLRVAGIEIYNGFTLSRVKKEKRKHDYRGYDESCWDDLLTAGRRTWGFAANDSFFHNKYSFGHFDYLGVVYAHVPTGHASTDIVAALGSGRFYSSTGVRLSNTPISVENAADGSVRISVSSLTPVHWTARIHQQVGATWQLVDMHVRNSQHAEFRVPGTWKYVRVRAVDASDDWKRAWLQPITNSSRFGN